MQTEAHEAERMAELRAEGKGTWDIVRIIKRERILREIDNIASFDDVAVVLRAIVEQVM